MKSYLEVIVSQKTVEILLSSSMFTKKNQSNNAVVGNYIGFSLGFRCDFFCFYQCDSTTVIAFRKITAVTERDV